MSLHGNMRFIASTSSGGARKITHKKSPEQGPRRFPTPKALWLCCLIFPLAGGSALGTAAKGTESTVGRSAGMGSGSMAALPAPIVGTFHTREDRDAEHGSGGAVYLITVALDKSNAPRSSRYLAAKSASLDRVLPAELAALGETIVSESGTIAALSSRGFYGEILAILPSQALSAVRMENAVVDIERRSLKEVAGVARMTPEWQGESASSLFRAGGFMHTLAANRDLVAPRAYPVGTAGLTHTRVLVNGVPIGLAANGIALKTDIAAPYLSGTIMMASARELGIAFDYTVSIATVCGAKWPVDDGTACDSATNPPAPRPLTATASIAATNASGSPLLNVRAGDMVKFVASGSWSEGGGSLCPVNGGPCPRREGIYVPPELGAAVLLGSSPLVGYFTGTTTVTIPSAGMLYGTVADAPGYFGDNSGTISINASIVGGPPAGGVGNTTPRWQRVTLTATAANTFGVRSIQFLEGSTGVKITRRDGSKYVAIESKMPEKKTAPSGATSLMVSASSVATFLGAKIKDYDADTKSLQTYYYENLNSNGLYFIGVQSDTSTTDKVGEQKLVRIGGNLVPNTFYDPSRPTVIYSHGWNKNAIVDGKRESLLFNQAGLRVNTQNAWINAGYNVGIFHWPQFSDDDTCTGCLEPRSAEEKIYAYGVLNPGLRWKGSDGAYRNGSSNPTPYNKPVAQQYADALNLLTRPAEVLVGNSLGGQLTLNAAALATRKPNRIAFMDPYWSAGSEVAGARRDTALRLSLLKNAGVPMETFYSSLAGGVAGFNANVWINTARRQAFIDWTSNVATKHVQHTRVYFMSFACSTAVRGMARYPKENLRGEANSLTYFEQNAGAPTANACDDTYNVAKPY